MGKHTHAMLGLIVASLMAVNAAESIFSLATGLRGRLEASGTDSNKDGVDLITFDGNPSSSHKFEELNDPVMGGQSNGTWSLGSGYGIFDGYVNIVPSLKAPGFIKASARDGKFTDVSSMITGGLVLSVRSSTPEYEGFRVTIAAGALSPQFSCAAGGAIIGSRGCYKAHFNVPAGDSFTKVYIPFNKFSDKWNSATGEQTVTCAKDPSVCPTAKKLEEIQMIEVWGEGKLGRVHLEIQSISAALSSNLKGKDNGGRPPKQFDNCKGPVQPGLRYNMSIFTSSDGVPVRVNASETLATAICCDTRAKVFAEPQFLFQSPYVNLFAKMNKTGITTFYDSVCGVPLFHVPKGRTFADWEKDTNEHGWPSFRKDEIVAENVKTDKDGFVYSSCGTHLGSYLPDGPNKDVPRWCLDLSCVAGNPASQLLGN